MKINANQIPFEGLALRQDIDASLLELDTEFIRFQGPIRVTGEASKITNTVTVNLALSAVVRATCVRCLEEYERNIEKQLSLVYEVENENPVIDLDPRIREEIIIDYPLKALCSDVCKGLCPKCGRNLNQGRCSCK